MEADLPELLHLSLEIDENEPRAGILELLQKIRPHWRPEQVQLKAFTEGITNRLIGCFLSPDQDQDSDPDQTRESLLVRVYGRHTDLYVDRTEELRMVRVLESRGLGQKIYCSFTNGVSYEFLQGAPLSYNQLTEPQIYRLIAAEMARLHSVRCVRFGADDSEPLLWNKMEHFLNLIQTSQSESRKESDSQSEEKKNHSDQPELRSRFWSGPVPGPEVLRTEMERLKKTLGRLKTELVLCHNDLLDKNIIYNQEQGCVRFIDFEYGFLNFAAFDIGNHFNEYAGLNPVDFGRFPSPGLRRDWIRTYLQHYTGSDVSEQEVTQLHVHVCKFSLASNLFWGMWAILQSRLSSIDFNYTRYAAAKLDFYFQKRDQFLSLESDQDLDQDWTRTGNTNKVKN